MEINKSRLGYFLRDGIEHCGEGLTETLFESAWQHSTF